MVPPLHKDFQPWIPQESARHRGFTAIVPNARAMQATRSAQPLPRYFDGKPPQLRSTGKNGQN
jgi:hypothetical protein